EAAAGRIVCVEIEGPPGIGKSALLQCFLRELELGGKSYVFGSRCHANEHIPFKAVDHLIESLAATVLSEEEDGPILESLGHVAELFPGLVGLHERNMELVRSSFDKATPPA